MPAAESWDLVVAGGGPAGLVAAIEGCRAGFRTVVLDRRRPPVDQACGEGLMPDGVKLLEQLGVAPASLSAREFRGVRYVDGPRVAEGRFSHGCGFGIRRTVLHDALRRQAEAHGAELRWGVKVSGLSNDGFDTDRGPVRGRWLVAADGRGSRIRRMAGLEGRPVRRPRFGLRRHFAVEPWTDLVEVHWGPRCEAYVTPVGDREIGVALLWTGRSPGFAELLGRFPELEQRLRGATATSRDRGAGPFGRRCRRPAIHRLALVGDASLSLDPITGEGLSLAFRQATAAVRAATQGDLSRYESAHRRIVRLPVAMSRVVLMLEKSTWLRRRAVRSLGGDREIMSRFLDLVTSEGRRGRTHGSALVPLVFAVVFGRSGSYS